MSNKVLTSFRLSETAKSNLKNLSETHKASQSEVIEGMVQYFTNRAAEEGKSSNLEAMIETKRLENNPKAKEIIDNYERLKKAGLL